ncbi:hypothetical protein L226DRAFT_575644 [Lentinus tigrinus ALCF2SS1-7]|uniref:Uncharacterized protein n=1 Tax=Lentinus tigrinus ALCF2SS1-6 TaxID=1328759 RepID=A0A5C2RSZ1_9APHY|nr:hypothetical protein L227DRAFT_580456 [Lentinus tigrinus ALCF2SS1-6]RPD69324.1 hypothetical protein L226DRAFT_575644 [Lentinus tigrinus ALCF2SS1-7]
MEHEKDKDAVEVAVRSVSAPETPHSPSAPPATPHDPPRTAPSELPTTSGSSPPSIRARAHSSAIHYLLTCTRILAACTIVTTLLSIFGWLVITHIYARVHPTTPFYIDIFLQASAAGGALLGACLAFSLCAFYTARHRYARRRPGSVSQAAGAAQNQMAEEGVFPPLHVLSAADVLLYFCLVLVGVAFSAAVGMALFVDPKADSEGLGLHEAAILGGFCAIPGGVGLVWCGCRHVRRLVRTRRARLESESRPEEKV